MIAVVGVFTLDVYLPGMQSMAEQFSVGIKDISYTFTAFSIVFAFSQLFHGVISDTIGRKPVIICGLAIAALATYLCINAQSYGSLFLSRMLQAVGISSFVVVNAIIRDIYIGTIAVQVRTMVATASGVSISIAPTVGGLLQGKFGWQGGFMASLLLICMTMVFAVVFFTESNFDRKNNDLGIIEFAKSYVILFKDKNYYQYVAIAMLAYTVHFSFIIMSANIFINQLGLTPLMFGYLMIFYGSIYFASGLCSTWIAKKLSINDLILVGSLFIGMGGMMLLTLIIMSGQSAWQILLPMAVITMGVTVARASSITGALAPIPSKAGQGAAGLNLVQFAVSALIATGITSFGNNQELSLSMLAMSCAFVIGYLRRRLENENVSSNAR